MILYMYIAPGQGLTTPWGQKFWCQQEHLVTSVICCKFQNIPLKSDFIQFFHDFIHVYCPGTGADSPPGDKVLMSTERPYLFTHLLLVSKMHTKFQGHQPFGSREEDFLRFLPVIGMAAILVMWPGPFEQIFVPLSHRSSIWNFILIGPVFSEKKRFK